MPLEDPNWINELVQTNPEEGDSAADTNEHLQRLKRVLQNTFPDSGAIGQWDGNLFLGPEGAGTPTGDASVNNLTAVGSIANKMVPIAAGVVDAAGNLVSGFGVQSASRTAEGFFNVTLVESATTTDPVIAIASTASANYNAAVNATGATPNIILTCTVWDIQGGSVGDFEFHFVAFKNE